ncbi:MAG: uracil-DNA glycosylase [Rhizobiales bacterium]|nr:uracil-DNA glycosylase [Hyphomicrobiales bacterium]
MPRTAADITPAEAEDALIWLVEMGADEIIGESPVNRLALPAETPRPQPAPRIELPQVRQGRVAAATAPLQPRAATSDSVQDARAIAAACSSLVELAEALSQFDACPLRKTATNLCFSDGNPDAHVLVIGEAPGNEEDLQGKPFVGRSGQLLDRMLATVGLDRRADDPARAVLITNTIFWRPPGNRKPTEAETAMCMPFVSRLVEVMRPRLILCVGATPTQRMMNLTDGILKLRGRWFDVTVDNGTIPLLATLHPAYLLRQPVQKKLAWRDLLSLRERLDNLSSR